MSIKHREPPLLQLHITFESCYGQRTESPHQTSVGGTLLCHLETLNYKRTS